MFGVPRTTSPLPFLFYFWLLCRHTASAPTYAVTYPWATLPCTRSPMSPHSATAAKNCLHFCLVEEAAKLSFHESHQVFAYNFAGAITDTQEVTLM